MMTTTQIEAKDRRGAGVHEAGHLVIGRHLGLRSGLAWIFPTRSETQEDKMWGGQFSFIGIELKKLSLRRQMMIGIAGFVAERSWERYTKPEEWQLDYAEALVEPDEMSKTDWALARHRPGDPTSKLVQACADVDALLLPGGLLWSALLVETRRLMQDAGAVRSIGAGI